MGSPCWFARIKGAVEGMVTSWKKMPSFFSGAVVFAFAARDAEAEVDESAEAPARGFPGTASGLSTTPGTSALTVTSAFLAPGSSCGKALAMAPRTNAASCTGLDAETAAAEELFPFPLSEFMAAASRVAAEDMFS